MEETNEGLIHTYNRFPVVFEKGEGVYLYDDEGKLTDEILMEVGGECPVLQIPAGQWHDVEVLESGTVIFEAKDGAYVPLGAEDIR